MIANQAAIPDFPQELAGLGPRLGQVITHIQLSQSEFARRIGVSAGFMSEVVRGNKRPGAEFLLAIHGLRGICGLAVDRRRDDVRRHRH